MEALYLLIPLSLAIVALAAWVFLRMSDSGQFDDMEGPAYSILLDDDRPAAATDGTPPAIDPPPAIDTATDTATDTAIGPAPARPPE